MASPSSPISYCRPRNSHAARSMPSTKSMNATGLPIVLLAVFIAADRDYWSAAVPCLPLEHLPAMPFDMLCGRCPVRPLGLPELLAVVGHQRLMEPRGPSRLVGDN